MLDYEHLKLSNWHNNWATSASSQHSRSIATGNWGSFLSRRHAHLTMKYLDIFNHLFNGNIIYCTLIIIYIIIYIIMLMYIRLNRNLFKGFIMFWRFFVFVVVFIRSFGCLMHPDRMWRHFWYYLFIYYLLFIWLKSFTWLRWFGLVNVRYCNEIISIWVMIGVMVKLQN